MQVAVVSRAKTMAIVFEESNLPKWASRMINLRQGQDVEVSLFTPENPDLGLYKGKIESFGNAASGAIVANLTLASGKKHTVQLVHRKNH